MDLPWNSAVLEQRIDRVYRIGQRRGVQVINLVAQGSIEDGMQSVLAFKRSLFDGVLDGGAADVFMHGTRLSQFMKSVGAATAAGSSAPGRPSVVPDAAGLPSRPEATASGSAESAPGPELRQAEPIAAEAPTVRGEPGARASAASDPWAPLIDAGLGLLRSLSAAAPGDRAAPGTSSLPVDTDPATGRRFVRLPLPDPAVLKPLDDALAALLAGLKR